MRLYLKNLPLHTNQDDVFHYLERFGRLTELRIHTGTSSDYGFAQFASDEDANYVLETFRGRLFLGHRTVIEIARPMRKDRDAAMNEARLRDAPDRLMHGLMPHTSRPKPYPSRGPSRFPVVVENIPRHIHWQELKDFGRSAGGIVAFCDLIQLTDSNTRPGGNRRGFIEYLLREDAEEAIRTLNGRDLGGSPVVVCAPSSQSNGATQHTQIMSSEHSRRSRSRSPPRWRAHAHAHPPSTLFLRSPGEGRTRGFPTSASRYSLVGGHSHVSDQGLFERAETPYTPLKSLGDALYSHMPRGHHQGGENGTGSHDQVLQPNYKAYIREFYDRNLQQSGCHSSNSY